MRGGGVGGCWVAGLPPLKARARLLACCPSGRCQAHRGGCRKKPAADLVAQR